MYRFHLLEDAQIALDAGNLKLALQAYEKAATDQSLMNSASDYELTSMNVNILDRASLQGAAKVAGQYQTAFAYFRIIVLSINVEPENRLQQMIKQMALRYPSGQPGHEFVELALLFQSEYQVAQDLQQACEKVNTEVDHSYSHLTGRNGHVGNWGDQAFTINFVCPKQ